MAMTQGSETIARMILVATTALAGLAAGPMIRADAAETLTFAPIEAPTSDQAKREVRASPEITLDGTSSKVGFVTLLRSGDKLGSGTFGLILDEKACRSSARTARR